MSMNEFETIKRLGSGSFANVFKVKRKKDGEIYALKKVKLQKLAKKGIDFLIMILMGL